jgi:hypothetical protein
MVRPLFESGTGAALEPIPVWVTLGLQEKNLTIKDTKEFKKQVLRVLRG